MGDMNPTTTTPFSQRAEPSPLWSGAFPKRRTGRRTTWIFRVRCETATRGFASRAPLPARRGDAPHGREEGGESDPTLLTAGAPRGRTKVAAKMAALCPPCGEVALTTVIPGGKAIEPAGRLAQGTAEPRQRTSRPQLAHWTRPTPGGPWPLRVNGHRKLQGFGHRKWQGRPAGPRFRAESIRSDSTIGASIH